MAVATDVVQKVVPVARDADIVAARQAGRSLATTLGFTGSDLTVIATAISEVARNIVVYAGCGEIVVDTIQEGRQRGILIVARDQGPGIANLDQAMQDGFSTSGSLGLGLPGARRLMNELTVESEIGKGTTVTMKKWLPRW